MWSLLSPETADIHAAFAPLAQKGVEFNRPWSVAELQLRETDVDWLGRWFAALPREATLATPSLLHLALPREKFAALLIVLGAERCRSFAREDHVWPELRKIVPDSHPLLTELFLSNGQPTYLTKLAVEEAARFLNLRNAFDVEGTQQWRVTIKLQFGFTHRGAKHRLAEWLVGLGSPHAVQYLGGQAGPSGLESKTFVDLWRTLRQYRRELISEEQAREVLQGSPWVKPAWIDDLLAEARSRVATLGRGDDHDVADRGVVAGGSPEERGPLEAIALSWPAGGRPRIVFRLDRDAIGEECKNAQCTELDFHVDGQWTGRWMLQPDGAWDGPELVHAETGRDPARVNLAPKTLAVRSGSGDIIQQWDLADFGLQGDVLVFDLDGEQLVEFGESSLDPGSHYALVCDHDYGIEGCDNIQTFELSGSPRKVIRLPCPLVGNLRLSYQGFTIWQPVRPQTEGRPRITATLKTLGDKTVSIGEKTRLMVEGLPLDAHDVSLLVGRRVEPAELLNGAWASAREIVVSPELAVGQKPVRVKCMCGETQTTVLPRRALRIKGLATIVPDARHPEAEPKLTMLQPTDLLHRTADGAQVRIWVPDESTSARAFEGHYFVGPLRYGRLRLKDFAGLGGQLTVRGRDIHSFGNPCFDTGLIRGVNRVGGDRPTQVSLRVKIRPESGSHRFVAWQRPSNGRTRVATLPPAALQTCESSRVWQVSAPEDMLALALTWRGTWRGAWWRRDRLVQCTFEPTTPFFAAIRWFRMPVLDPELTAWLEPLVLASPFSFLEAWLQNAGLHPDLCSPDHEPAHDTVIRQFIGHWRPQNEAQCHQGVKMITGTEPRARDALLLSVDQVSRYSLPLLWWVAVKIGNEGRALLRQAIVTLLGLEADQPDGMVAGRLDGLRRRASEYCACSEEGTDELTGVVLTWLGRSASALQQQSREGMLLALGSESGRRYFAARVLLHEAERRERTR